MSRRFILRRPADEDLDGHFLFIAEDSVEAAVRFYEAARAAFERLVEMPEIGALRPYLNPKLLGLRMWPIPDFPNHLVFYCRIEEGIEIVRVLHAKRDVEGVLESE